MYNLVFAITMKIITIIITNYHHQNQSKNETAFINHHMFLHCDHFCSK